MLLDSLKAAARSHISKWPWSFEPFVYVSSRDHTIAPVILHDYLLRVRIPPTIDGMQMSSRRYCATMMDKSTHAWWPVIICKTPHKELRGISLRQCEGNRVAVLFWGLRGLQNTGPFNTKSSNILSLPTRRNHGMGYDPRRYRQFLPSKIIVLDSKRKLADRREILLDYTDNHSFHSVATDCIEILHKSYRPVTGYSKHHCGIAVSINGKNFAFEPYLHDV